MHTHKILPFSAQSHGSIPAHSILVDQDVRFIVFKYYEQMAACWVEIHVPVFEWTRFMHSVPEKALHTVGVILYSGGRVPCKAESIVFADSTQHSTAPILTRRNYRLVDTASKQTLVEIVGVAEWHAQSVQASKK